MTYLQFHLVFTLPVLAVLVLLALRARRRGAPIAGALAASDRTAVWVLLVHLGIAFVYTTPWDNYLVYRDVWGYPDGRVLATIGWVPVEEYLFFLVQTALTGTLLFLLARRAPALLGRDPAVGAPVEGRGVPLRIVGSVVLLLAAVLGGVALTTSAGTYLGLIVVWAAPVLALQWAFGADLFLQRWRLVALAVGLPTLWLWIADRVAIGAEIWWISELYTTGISMFGLPVEEALFFLVTNLLVVFGMTMALHPQAMARVRALRAARGDAWKLVLVLWGLSMVPAPLLPDAFPVLAYVSTGLLTLGTAMFAWQRFGRGSLGLLAVALLFGLGIEWLGSRTGIPFGAYDYTAPGPTIVGVPLLVPLGWWAFTMIAVSAAPRLARWADVRLVAPAVLVAWDLGLDPLMVAEGFWRFERGAFYGVPWSNFLGWYLSGVVLVTLLVALEPRLRDLRSPDLRTIFVVQGMLMGGGLVFFGLAGAAPWAVAAMAAVVVAWRFERTARPVADRATSPSRTP